ncbi:MAG: sigma-54 dependent transcriptional regulator [Polyangiales bacterium]
MCIDLGLGDVPGQHVLKHLRARDPELPVIVVTAQRNVDTAVEAMRAGAYDYLVKPIDDVRLAQALRRAAERRELSMRVRRLQDKLGALHGNASMVGESPPMQELTRQIGRVLESEVSVCLLGESGTGKEVVARAIHQGGKRAKRPFIAVNCAAIPQTLQESELFGHERGAFTGATGTHLGRFEQGAGGTLFLDELGEMSLSTQASLLRTLQERTIRRVGGSAEIPVDVRIIGATHRDLGGEVKAGRFRADLFFRLVVYPIRVPPLRERKDDIPALVGHFLRKLSHDVGRNITHIEPEALQALAMHSWPGNVRELQNVVHRAMLACNGDDVTLGDLPPDLRSAALPSLPRLHAADDTDDRMGDEVLPLHEVERRAIVRALRVSHGRVAQAALLLGVGRATLYRRMSEFGLPSEDP